MSLASELQIDEVIAGRRRLTRGEALRLHREASLHDLGRWADAVCRRVHGDTVRTFVKDRNVNYTNVCSARCTFCEISAVAAPCSSTADAMAVV